MDVVAGKGGNFFVVNGSVSNTILNMLSEISYEEFGKYNAYSTMKKISRQSPAEYAAKNGLRQNIVENFSRLEEVIDYHATQDLMYFIESEDGRERSDSYDNDVVVNPANYNNGFLYAGSVGADYRFFSNSRRFGAAFAEKRRHIDQKRNPVALRKME